MSIDNALFLVSRNRDNYHVTGATVKDKILAGDRVLVQRGTDHFYAWRNKPSDTDLPYMTRRFYYKVEEPDVDKGEDQRQHPDGDGLINLSLYFGNAGPYPTNEWKNLRNKQTSINDIDGLPFRIQNNPDVQDGDIVHITEEGGPFQGWYEIRQDTNDWVSFKEQYYRKDHPNDQPDNPRPRVDISQSGARPAWDGTVVLKFEFYRDFDSFAHIEDTDLLLANDDQGNICHVTGSKFKDLFLPPPVAISKPVIEYDGETDSYGRIKYNKVSSAVMNRPSDSHYGEWAYYRSGMWTGNKYDYNGYYYFDYNVERVKYTEKHNYGGKLFVVESDVLPFGPP